MLPTSYVALGEKTSPIWCEAFARGCDGPITTSEVLQPGPVAMFGSPRLWPILEQARAEDRTWYYGDKAYFGRGEYFRITRNAFQHDGLARADVDRSRWAAFNRPIQPWRASGSHVLICPNSDAYMRQFGLPSSWLTWLTAGLRMQTDRELRVRWKFDAKPLAVDLEDCWAVVTYASTCAVDALIAGVPVFTLAQHASTWRMGSNGSNDAFSIEHPIYPDDREEFCQALAANQWTLPEMAAGVAWRALREDS